ncbi:hypothetical protein ABPG72_002356 [Tetrahymena utriculariae]
MQPKNKKNDAMKVENQFQEGQPNQKIKRTDSRREQIGRTKKYQFCGDNNKNELKEEIIQSIKELNFKKYSTFDIQSKVNNNYNHNLSRSQSYKTFKKSDMEHGRFQETDSLTSQMKMQKQFIKVFCSQLISSFAEYITNSRKDSLTFDLSWWNAQITFWFNF